MALPAPETPSLSFTIAWLSDGRLARMLCTPATMSSTVWRSSAPTGHGTPSSSNILRQPVLLPRSASRGSAPYIGIPRLSATSRSSGVVL